MNCVIVHCFDIETIQKLPETSFLWGFFGARLILEKSFTRNAWVSSFGGCFFKGKVSGGRKPVVVRMQRGNRRVCGKGNDIIGRLEGEFGEFCSPLEKCCVAEGALLEKGGLIFEKMEVFARLVH